MERFIVLCCTGTALQYTKFKIQYGEIYSVSDYQRSKYIPSFKIQYGEIYSIL